jgi:pimeloyl-ACP methyl ester carboxylesterase
MRYVDLDDGRVAVHAWGSGDAVVALHCSASSGRQWGALAGALEGSHRIIAPDLYGNGASDPWPGRAPLRMRDQAQLVMSAITDIAEPVHLVGHSYGGAVALKLALKFPSRFRSVMLIEPVAFNLLRQGGVSDRRLFAEIGSVAAAVSAAAVKGDHWSGMERFVDYWSGAGAWADLWFDKRAALAASAMTVAREFASLFAETTHLSVYRGLTVPTTIVKGGRSPETTRRIADLLHATLPDARMKTVAEAGHMMPLSHPEAVIAALRDHLDRATPVTAERRPRVDAPAAPLIDGEPVPAMRLSVGAA